ncbi:TraR/DksA C4-type zinc finger protein [Alkalihalophilus marmarensis]|uniref:TraR/DksA C4-type zinc finger protein n=1 Tax=Alkalihalophilus marmarensis TaxID=521377 RepID=UPI002E1E3BBA|nr:TraR/DksA C4-type zinc finger protein [Alkalihalophilus marmarensis]MED1602824.1 TraR/DksA C4-type zinc finger protein [Alkalihalophilus marmarensis]
MLTNEQLQTLENKLLQMKKEIEDRVSDDTSEADLENQGEDTGELSNYDNHPGDLATELHDRELEAALDQHSKDELEEINQALAAIEDGTYGICEVCGEPIPFERLEALPTARRRIEHADVNIEDETRRPVEEEVMNPTIAAGEEEENEMIYDREDTWRDISEHGTSESPSDLTDPEEGYNPEPAEEEPMTELDQQKVADIKGNDSGRTSDRKEHK